MIRCFAPILAACLVVTPFSTAQAAEGQSFLGLLVTGKSTAGVDRADVEAMQAAHLKNFSRLGKLGDLQAAGPCADPEKKIRGIVVVTAASKSAAMQMFTSDPYVQRGYMDLQLEPQEIIAGKLKVGLTDEAIEQGKFELEQDTIVLFAKSDKWPSEAASQTAALDAYRKWAKESHAAREAGFASLLTQGEKYVACAILRGNDTAAVQKIVDGCPLVRDGQCQAKSMLQMIVKGAMDE